MNTNNLSTIIFSHLKDIDECIVNNNGGCDQNCTNTIGSFECSCTDGYYLMSDTSCVGKVFLLIRRLLFLSDINECAINNGGCGQVCTNQVPFFSCSCNNGYRLYNETLCTGMNLPSIHLQKLSTI